MSTRAVTPADSASAFEPELNTPDSLEEALETGFLPEDPHYRLTGEFKPKEDKPVKEGASAASKKNQDSSVKEESSADSDADAAASAAADSQKDERSGQRKTSATSESRWAKITRENRELKDRLARLEAAQPAKESQRDTQQTSQPAAAVDSNPRPKIDDVDPKTGQAKFKTFAEYETAKDEWLQSEAIRKFQETSAKTQRERDMQQAEQTLAQGFAKKLEPIRTKHADFDQVALNPDLILPKGSVADAFLLDSDHAGEVLYHLGQHPEILEGFYENYDPQTGKFSNKVTPQRQFRRLMEIEAEFSGKASTSHTSARTVTQAARPPHQVSGKGTVAKDAVAQAVEDGDSEAYIREQNARELARRRR